MARKAADGNWLIAAATNEAARTIKIPLSILGKGNYEAFIIQDGKDADFRTNKESYMSVTRMVNNTQALEVKLASGGGACILLQLKATQQRQ